MHNGGDGGDHDGETYILLVDDDDGGAANLESLNSQTLYIDSTSLANGDLSNVVLMTGPPPTAPSVGQVNATFLLNIMKALVHIVIRSSTSAY